jgi:hypothetical protein
MQVDFSRNVDPVTGLMGYARWTNGGGDPDVDAPYHTMHYYFLASHYRQDLDYNRAPLKPRFKYALEQFTHSDGVFRRFPTCGKNAKQSDGTLNPHFGITEHSYFNRPENLSRDNTLPIILACGEFGEHEVIKDFAINMLKRGSFFQNTHDTRGKKKVLRDFATPDHWTVIIRAYLKARQTTGNFNRGIAMLLLPFLLVGDLFNVLSNLLTVLHSWYEPNHAPSELGHVCRTLQAQNMMPTPLSWLARMIYVKGRRTATSVFPDKIRHVGKWEYFKLWLKVTFWKQEKLTKEWIKKWGREMLDLYYDESAVMSGLNYFFRGEADAPFPEYCKDAVRRIEG